MNECAIHIRLTGRVQGVGFRSFVKARADERGIAGWVRNLPDGSLQVFSVLQKEETASWVEIVRQGPAGSVVDTLEVRMASPDETAEWPINIREFRIERAWE